MLTKYSFKIRNYNVVQIIPRRKYITVTMKCI